MIVWSVELSKFSIRYQPHKHINSRVLSDFCAKLSSSNLSLESNPWILFVNGAFNIKGSGAEIILEGINGLTLKQSLGFNFKATNNQSEYETLIVGLNLAREMRAA